jgi:hypothetical protein
MMSYKEELKEWVLDAIDAHSGAADVVQVARHIWQNHEADLQAAGDAFYTWQYDMRWAAQALRDEGVLVAASDAPRGRWQRKNSA